LAVHAITEPPRMTQLYGSCLDAFAWLAEKLRIGANS
jgi:hypothetical protein